MPSELKKLMLRNKALKKFDELFSRREKVLIIHYSCESFDGLPEEQKPRVTSIAIRNLSSGQTTSYSIHNVAEYKKVDFVDIDSKYDALERQMLKKFFQFLSEHKTYDWVHWNMRNDTYGFSVLEDRFKNLGGKPKKLDDSHKFDLSNALVEVFGNEYIEHPRLIKLMEANKIPYRNFLTGPEEAKAFENKEYIKMHQSTLRKVDALRDIFGRVIDNTIKTNATWRDRHGVHPLIILECFLEHWGLKLILALASLYSFFF